MVEIIHLYDVSRYLERIIQKMSMLPSGVGLELTEDVANFIKPKKCGIVQLINYRNDDQIYVDSDLWNLLSPTQKAAALVHETIYLFLRESSKISSNKVDVKFAESDSTRVRKVVAYLFSKTPLESVWAEDGPKDGMRIACYNQYDPISLVEGETKLVLYKDFNGRMRARFSRISGKIAITRSEALFDEEDGLQSIELNSLIDKGISFIFNGIPDLKKLEDEKVSSLRFTIHNKIEKKEYNSTFNCYQTK